MKKASFDVMGMSCSACSTRVEKAVGKVVGSENVSVNLLTNSMQLKYDEAQTNPAVMMQVQRRQKSRAETLRKSR